MKKLVIGYKVKLKMVVIVDRSIFVQSINSVENLKEQKYVILKITLNCKFSSKPFKVKTYKNFQSVSQSF